MFTALIAQFLRKMKTDPEFRADRFLQASFLWNIAFALYNMVFAILALSPWMGTIAGCYLLLAWLRFSLIRCEKVTDLKASWRNYRRCGICCFLFCILLIGMSVLLIVGEKVISYPGHLIYAACAYAFYAIISSTIKVIRKRNDEDPPMMAARNLSLIKAMISIYFVQSALISTFGGSPDFHRLMSILTGCAFFVLILLISAAMVCRGNRELRQISA